MLKQGRKARNWVGQEGKFWQGNVLNPPNRIHSGVNIPLGRLENGLEICNATVGFQRICTQAMPGSKWANLVSRWRRVHTGLEPPKRRAGASGPMGGGALKWKIPMYGSRSPPQVLVHYHKVGPKRRSKRVARGWGLG